MANPIPSPTQVVEIVLGLLLKIERTRIQEGADILERNALRVANEKVRTALASGGATAAPAVAESAVSVANLWTPTGSPFREALAMATKTLTALRPATSTPNVDEYLRCRRETLLSGISTPEITMEAIEGWDLRAHCSLQSREKAVVQLTEGACAILSDLFLRMFAHRECFKTIGDVSKEVVTTPTLTDFHFDLGELVRDPPDGSPLSYSLPRCPIRFRHAHYLMTLALDFLIQHEIVHILHGHAGLQKAEGLAHLTRPQRWALELDADMTSAVACVRRARWGVQLQKRLSPQQHLVGSTTDEETIRDVMIAVHACFLLWQEQIRNGTESDSHPNPRERQRLVVGALNTFARRNFGGERVETILSVVADCECAFHHVTGRPIDVDGIHAMFLDRNDTLRTFFEGWAAVRDELAPHAYVPLPHPSPWSEGLRQRPDRPPRRIDKSKQKGTREAREEGRSESRAVGIRSIRDREFGQRR